MKFLILSGYSDAFGDLAEGVQPRPNEMVMEEVSGEHALQGTLDDIGSKGGSFVVFKEAGGETRGLYGWPVKSWEIKQVFI